VTQRATLEDAARHIAVTQRFRGDGPNNPLHTHARDAPSISCPSGRATEHSRPSSLQVRGSCILSDETTRVMMRTEVRCDELEFELPWLDTPSRALTDHCRVIPPTAGRGRWRAHRRPPRSGVAGFPLPLRAFDHSEKHANALCLVTPGVGYWGSGWAPRGTTPWALGCHGRRALSPTRSRWCSLCLSRHATTR